MKRGGTKFYTKIKRTRVIDENEEEDQEWRQKGGWGEGGKVKSMADKTKTGWRKCKEEKKKNEGMSRWEEKKMEEENEKRKRTRTRWFSREPLVSPDLAIYIFKQVKVKMTLDLVMSPWSMSNMKLLIVYLWFKFSCNKSESVYEEFEWCH